MMIGPFSMLGQRFLTCSVKRLKLAPLQVLPPKTLLMFYWQDCQGDHVGGANMSSIVAG